MAKEDRKFSLEEEEEGGEDWLTSYSDLVTDLLAIFVILFSFALLSQGKMKDTGGSESVPAAVTIMEETISSQQNQREKEKSKADELTKAMNEYLKETAQSESIDVVQNEDNTILLRMNDSVLFVTAQADVTTEAGKILDSVSQILDGYEENIKLVRIEGHTDNRPISNARYKSNWDLSTSRAVSVVEYLLRSSPLGPDKFSAVGYSEYHPIDDNTTEEGRAKNRRVDFIIEMVSEASIDEEAVTE